MNTVLVLCTGNSARSQMAEAVINALWGDGWRAESAGTEPARCVHPMAIRVMKELDISMSGARPKHIDEFKRRSFDLVITVCDSAVKSCPLWVGGGERVHCGLPDPAAASGDEGQVLAAFRRVRDDIIDRIGAVLAARS